MYQRLKSAKPTYSRSHFENDYQKSKYTETLIKFKNTNPNIFFETPEKFQKKLYKEINNEMMMRSTGFGRSSEMGASQHSYRERGDFYSSN